MPYTFNSSPQEKSLVCNLLTVAITTSPIPPPPPPPSISPIPPSPPLLHLSHSSLPSLLHLPLRYNLEGDLLFSVAKDSKPTVWYSSNGERLGTYNGHNGAVWGVGRLPYLLISPESIL